MAAGGGQPWCSVGSRRRLRVVVAGGYRVKLAAVVGSRFASTPRWWAPGPGVHRSTPGGHWQTACSPAGGTWGSRCDGGTQRQAGSRERSGTCPAGRPLSDKTGTASRVPATLRRAGCACRGSWASGSLRDLAGRTRGRSFPCCAVFRAFETCEHPEGSRTGTCPDAPPWAAHWGTRGVVGDAAWENVCVGIETEGKKGQRKKRKPQERETSERETFRKRGEDFFLLLFAVVASLPREDWFFFSNTSQKKMGPQNDGESQTTKPRKKETRGNSTKEKKRMKQKVRGRIKFGFFFRKMLRVRIWKKIKRVETTTKKENE